MPLVRHEKNRDLVGISREYHEIYSQGSTQSWIGIGAGHKGVRTSKNMGIWDFMGI